jgi:hypothetical protein
VRREDGVAMTEFALVIPVFMLIVVGLLVVGRLFFYWIEANHLANETVRWAVVDRNPYYASTCTGFTPRPPCQSLQQHARMQATEEFDDNVSVCIDFPDPDFPNTFQNRADVVPGDPVRVQVELPVSFAEFFGVGVTIRGSATMRLERIANNIDPVANPQQDVRPPC